MFSDSSSDDGWNSGLIQGPNTTLFRSGKSYRSSTDQLDTGWYFYHLYVPFIEKEKRSDYCHAVCGCAKCDWKLFHFIGNFNEIPYEIKNGNINDESGKSINKTIGSDRFE